MTAILNAILVDANALKDALLGARANGDMTNGEAQQALSGLAVVIKVVKDIQLGTRAAVDG